MKQKLFIIPLLFISAFTSCDDEQEKHRIEAQQQEEIKREYFEDLYNYKVVFAVENKTGEQIITKVDGNILFRTDQNKKTFGEHTASELLYKYCGSNAYENFKDGSFDVTLHEYNGKIITSKTITKYDPYFQY